MFSNFRVKLAIATTVVLLAVVASCSASRDKASFEKLIGSIEASIAAGDVAAADRDLVLAEAANSRDPRLPGLRVQTGNEKGRQHCAATGQAQFAQHVAADDDGALAALAARCGRHDAKLASSIAAIRSRSAAARTEVRQAAADAGQMTVLTIRDFETGSFLKRYPVRRTNRWKLSAGGENFSYSFRDSEQMDQSIGVSLVGGEALVASIGISFTGSSTREPARLTLTRERFLLDLLAATFPDLDAKAIVAIVRAAQNSDYPGGSDTMPKTSLGTASIQAGTVGSGLVVVITR